MNSNYTLAEILAQPTAWSETLAQLEAQVEALGAFWREQPRDGIVFTACGSPYYLGLSAAALCRELGLAHARSFPASEVWLNPQLTFRREENTLLVTLSRSGETTETRRAVETFRAHGRGAVLTITCRPETSLTKAGDLNLALPAGVEQSVAQTRAFTTMWLAATWLAALWSGRAAVRDELQRLPQIGQRLLNEYSTLAAELGSDAALDRFYFLGSGVRYGVACEASLKMKEMSLSHSEPFYFLEFRHGPKSMVTPGTLVVGLLSDAQRQPEQAVLDEMRGLGGRVLALGESGADVAIQSGLSEPARSGLYLLVLQLLAYARARHKGLNPDQPTNLDAFVALK